MYMKKTLFTFIAFALFCTCTQAQNIPLVYGVENTAAANPDPVMPAFDQLPYVEPLPDPFEFSDKSGRALEFKDWSKRRGEISREIQHYEIGDKPAVNLDSIEASMHGDTLIVTTTVNGQKLTQSAVIAYPSGGTAPYPLMIGADNNSLPRTMFTDRNIATTTFTASQVNSYSQFGGSGSRGTYPFDALYPTLANNGAYSEWAWGFSRLLDGLQKLGPEVTKIDMKHIGVTGCSYAGKMALFCGAFDERVALTIAEEPGGGGAAAWRVTRVHNRDYTKEDAWEGLDNTDYSWFMKSLKETFGQDNTFYLPYDHHELAAMCCPRALLMLGNPDYKWLADGSGYISMTAARKVWQQYGIGNRCGFSIVGGHSHCQLPDVQYPEVEAFLDKYMLGIDTVSTDSICKAAEYQTGGSRATPIEDLGQWMDWWGTGVPPTLPNNKPVPVLIWGDPATMVSASTTDWTIETNADAPLGEAAKATKVNKTCPEDKAQALKFTFTVPTKQDYYIYAYVNCPKSSSDGFFIAFDDSVPMVSNGARSTGWAWKNLYSLLGSADKTKFMKTLDVGEHTLYIYDKEIDAQIGLICVSNDELLNDFSSDIKGINLGTVTGISGTSTTDGKSIQALSISGSQMQATIYTDDKFNGSIELYDVTGSLLSSKAVSLPSGSHTVTLPSVKSKGLFLIRMKQHNGMSVDTKKFVVR